MTDSGIDEWADTNKIIVLYPYAVAAPGPTPYNRTAAGTAGATTTRTIRSRAARRRASYTAWCSAYRAARDRCDGFMLANDAAKAIVPIAWYTALMARKASGKKSLYAIAAAKRGSAHFRVRPASRNGAKFDPTDPASIVQFREAAAKFREVHLGNQESARKVLAGEGIYTLGGELTEEYRA